LTLAVQIAKWLKYCLITSLMHAPAVVIFDDIDSLIPVLPDHAPPQEQHAIEFINEFLAGILDWLREQVRAWTAYFGAPTSYLFDLTSNQQT
jgi:hypothetical protein